MSNSQTDRSGAKLKPLGVISKSISLPDVMDQRGKKVKKRSTGRSSWRRFFKVIFHFISSGLLRSFSCVSSEKHLLCQPKSFVIMLSHWRWAVQFVCQFVVLFTTYRKYLGCVQCCMLLWGFTAVLALNVIVFWLSLNFPLGLQQMM